MFPRLLETNRLCDAVFANVGEVLHVASQPHAQALQMKVGWMMGFLENGPETRMKPSDVVERMRIELTTSALRTRRSPS